MPDAGFRSSIAMRLLLLVNCSTNTETQRVVLSCWTWQATSIALEGGCRLCQGHKCALYVESCRVRLNSNKEEALCYSSTLYSTLKPCWYPWPNLGPGSVAGGYSPGVVIFKDDLDHDCVNLPKEDWRVVSVITVAAPRAPRLTVDGQSFANESDLNDLRGKIKLIYRIAAQNKKRYLVLGGQTQSRRYFLRGWWITVSTGAMGCGAYACPPQLVAHEMKAILLEKEFGGYFDRVVFAVYSQGRNGNFSVFSAVWSSVEVWALHMYILGSSKNLLKQIDRAFDNQMKRGANRDCIPKTQSMTSTMISICFGLISRTDHLCGQLLHASNSLKDSRAELQSSEFSRRSILQPSLFYVVSLSTDLLNNVRLVFRFEVPDLHRTCDLCRFLVSHHLPVFYVSNRSLGSIWLVNQITIVAQHPPWSSCKSSKWNFWSAVSEMELGTVI